MSAEVISRISNWVAATRKWDDLFQETLEDHAGSVLDEFELNYDDLREVVGDGIYYMVLGSAFEDFLTLRIEGESAVDAYIRSEGKGEERASKEYLRALRDSVVSVYAVVERKEDGLVIRDLIRGGETMVDAEDFPEETIGGAMIARVLETTGNRTLNPARLPLALDEAEEVIEIVRAAIEQVEGSRRGKAVLSGRTLDDALAETADVFTAEWLAMVLSPLAEAGTRNLLVRFAVPEEHEDAIRERLENAKQLVRSEGDSWFWFPYAAPNAEQDEGDGFAGVVTLGEGSLLLAAPLEDDRLVGQGYLMGVLDGLIGLPDFSLPVAYGEEDI